MSRLAWRRSAGLSHAILRGAGGGAADFVAATTSDRRTRPTVPLQRISTTVTVNGMCMGAPLGDSVLPDVV
jgi:hypothetical protein